MARARHTGALQRPRFVCVLCAHGPLADGARRDALCLYGRAAPGSLHPTRRRAVARPRPPPPLRPRQMTPPHPDEHAERPLAALLAPDILALLAEAPGSVPAETEGLQPADLADVAETIPADRVIQLLQVLPAGRAAQVLEHLNEDLRSMVLEEMTSRQAAALVSEMSPDDRADALVELEEERAEEILAEIPAAERKETEQ